MNFVGPNLDSYYIAYHNRIDDNRFLNISHLLFSKNGQMVINGLKYENMFERPTFEKFIDKENYLSEEEITSEEKEDMTNTNKKIDELVEQRNSILSEYAGGNKLVSQLIDLALLANGMLKGEALSQFIKRSVQMIG